MSNSISAITLIVLLLAQFSLYFTGGGILPPSKIGGGIIQGDSQKNKYILIFF